LGKPTNNGDGAAQIPTFRLKNAVTIPAVHPLAVSWIFRRELPQIFSRPAQGALSTRLRSYIARPRLAVTFLRWIAPQVFSDGCARLAAIPIQARNAAAGAHSELARHGLCAEP
jgi:hypothetical protein